MSTLMLDTPTRNSFTGPEILQALSEALPDATVHGPVEIVLDVETTGLTPWAMKKTLTNGKDGDATPRCRVLSLFLPHNGFQTAVDLDQFSSEQKRTLVGMLHGHVWVGHNLLFDYQWLLNLHADIRPARIVDTMLMATAIRPEAVYYMQSVIVQAETRQPSTRKNYAEFARHVKDKMAHKTRSGDKEGGALSLDDLALWLFDQKLDKTFQKPQNWMPDYLSPAHYDYCMGDVDIPPKAARALLKIDSDTDIHGVLNALDNHNGGKAYRDMEEALHVLVRMQRKGLYWSHSAAAELDAALNVAAITAMDALEQIVPALGAFRERLLNPKQGMNDALKTAIDQAIRAETGQGLPTTDKGNPSLSAKDLEEVFPDSQVVTALQGVLKPVSERGKIPQYAALVAEDGRIHPMTGINTVTGRTSSQEPNLQNIPRDPRFRAIFAAPEGHKIIATDFSSIELRIGAALGVRSWRMLRFLREDNQCQSPQRQRIAWIVQKVPELLPWLSDPSEPVPARIAEANPFPDSKSRPGMDAWALAIACQLCVIVKKIHTATEGDEAKLPFRLAYIKGLDPHMITALAMESMSGRFELGGLTPIAYLESLTRDAQDALKKTLKGPRQAAKAVNFGLIYGMSAKTLWNSGRQSYGLKWTEAEAEAAKNAYFELFPEMGLWHWLLKNAFSQRADILNPYKAYEVQPATAGGKLYLGNTLSGRLTISSKMTSGANYQDQGTGAEIAFRALRALPEDIQSYLINFVHDELLLEVPEARVAEVQALVEKTMITAADSLLLRYGIPTEVETSMGDCWVH
ncbi:hypothetical protein A6M27_00250 [Acidithiobacillus thiooxidans]|uniref:DNA polymerase I n=1 Tax=Acidithiobacillus thiooxidans TaxID=930 RepID=A0A1C2INL0_ACITH|nr:DNA polymerase [Acidithiobacillus thiooxidans]OCX77475.1 hypothetical protein A6P07_00055 [Acidithiobacillus thiooxidans]OCX78344.1 hypothetical protein A6O24_04665 [Acidithiobacillus thiooxidans]OCX84718.1 hypothetical protein A6O26_03550 [Acidithiobacillus thiooxidans]OCX89688.1 hypothetical protein A6M27_00250 [Acidithiobacillus thiooxidans]OFC41986.1 hypothetical protein BAE47_16795 [Acidithiobacillus thiooxidans]